MNPRAELIRVSEQVAGKSVAIKMLWAAPDPDAAAIATANSELSSLIDRRDALQREVAGLDAEQSAAKSLRTPIGRQVIDDDIVDQAPRSGKSWGAQVVEQYRERAESRGVKSLLTAGDANIAARIGGPVENPRQAQFISELIPSEDAPGGAYAYLRQTVRDNNAAVVAPGAVKPTSTYTLERIDGTTDVIAHISEPINRFDLEDANVLQQFIDAEMRLGLELAIDSEVIDAIIAAGPLVEGDIGTTLDTTRRCVTRLEERSVVPTAWVLHPRDWEQIENEAQTTFAANPNMSPATDAVKRSLWGYPVVSSMSVPENTGYLGDFRNSALLYRTGGIRIDFSDAHYDSGVGATDFERNLVRFRAETRVTPAILRSFAFIEINLAGTGS